MSLKATETVYNLVIENVIKEINDDPQMSSISTEAIDYLSRVWKTKLHDSGVYTPHSNDYQKQMMNPGHLPIRPAGDFMNPSSNVEGMNRNFMTRPMYPFPYGYPGPYVAEPWFTTGDVKIPPEHLGMFPNNYNNIVYDAKATLQSGVQPPMQQNLLHHAGVNLHIAPQNMNQHNKKEPAKNPMSQINIKGEEDEQNNNSKLPVKVPANGGPSDINSTAPKKNDQAEKNKEKEVHKPVHEETKHNAAFNSDDKNQADNEHEEEDVDDADLFEYDVNDRAEVPQLKEEHIPPPLPSTNAGQPLVSVNDLNPYNPEDRPLDSDDDPDYGETIDTTDILIAFHEKVHRHGSKWKVTLKQGIMNAKGKEYILSHITGDFDFM